MFAVGTYEEIEKQEKLVDTKQLVVFLMVRPNTTSGNDIIREFEYIHYNSDGFCSIYAIGYTNDLSKSKDQSYKRIDTICNSDWYFSNKAFVYFKNKLETRIKWKYSGETEILLLQNNPGGNDPLNFKNYVAINIDKGLRMGYIDSFQALMESIVRSARSSITAKDVTNDIYKERIKIKDIIYEAVNECKTLPKPIQSILKDRLFYTTANSI